MNTIDRSNAKIISQEVISALADLGKKHGLKFTHKSGRFAGSNMTLTIEAAIINSDGVAETRERKDYTLYCNLYNLNPEWLDQSFKSNGKTYTIVGINPRKHKNPVLVKCSEDGKTYIMTSENVRHSYEVARPIQGNFSTPCLIYALFSSNIVFLDLSNYSRCHRILWVLNLNVTFIIKLGINQWCSRKYNH